MMTSSDRKQELLKHGAACREAIKSSADGLRQGISSGGPLDALRGLAGTVIGAVSGGGIASIARMAMPFAITAFSSLSSKRLLKPALRAAAVAGAVAAGYWFFRRKKEK